MNSNRLWTALAVIASALPACWALAEDRPNDKPSVVKQAKLSNTSFEEGDFLPTGWKQGTKITGVEYAWDKKVAREGKASVRITKTAKKYFPVASWQHALPHDGPTRKLELRAWVKADEMRKAILDVAFLDANEKWSHQWAAYIGAKNSDDDPADHDWTEYRGVVAVPEGTTQMIIGLQVYGPGRVWFDDVSAAYVADDTPASLYDETGKPRRQE